jgi:hypothetical protein
VTDAKPAAAGQVDPEAAEDQLLTLGAHIPELVVPGRHADSLIAVTVAGDAWGRVLDVDELQVSRPGPYQAELAVTFGGRRLPDDRPIRVAGLTTRRSSGAGCRSRADAGMATTPTIVSTSSVRGTSACSVTRHGRAPRVTPEALTLA